jgi:TetR/AcrR family transcriptional repressor of nem operon
MARPREFEAGVAVAAMMRAFWENGYEATSIDDLCEASGLSRSSLYSTFGDKHDVLLRSLTHYMESRIGHIQDVLLAETPIRDGLTALAEEIINSVVAGPGRRGCFIGNCAAEVSRGDDEAMALVRDGMMKMERIFRGALTRARARGEVSPSMDLDALARFLMASFQGLRLVGKANPDRKCLQDIVVVMLRCIG